MDEELARACANVLWTPINVSYQGSDGKWHGMPGWRDSNYADRHPSDITPELLADEIERRGLCDEYAEALISIVSISTSGAYWRLIRATPEQRVRAFLETIKQCDQ